MDVRRYVLTGTPGAGKTTLALALRGRGYHVVDEAATDLIGSVATERPDERPDERLGGLTDERPGEREDFLARIVRLQRQRQLAAGDVPVQLYDRSPLCTLALARYTGREPGPELVAELRRVERHGLYQRLVFLVQPIGFVTPTAARRITYPQSLRFAEMHEEVYREHGYDLLEIPPATVEERVAMIEERLR
jgi:predicted ATPase